ncbi:MAG: cell division protein ZapE [Parvularculaceae bacterium]
MARYTELVESGVLAGDPAQAEAAAKLQALSQALIKWRGARRRLFGSAKNTPGGLYLWGGVGRGKSLLMDIFFNNTTFTPKRRVHFHEFMAEIHERIAAWRAAPEHERKRHRGVNRKAPDDPMPPVAYDVAKDAKLLCFDEFHVTDIADAMILGRLFEALFARDVVVVATSNRPPDDLYKDGLNRQLFTPFIDVLKARLEVMEVDAAKDYRLDRLSDARVYHCPLGAQADAAMDKAWARIITGARERRENLHVKGRKVLIPRIARGAARFEFEELCARPLGASDYLAICGHCATLFIDHIPQMGPQNRNEAKRFVTLVDAIYETHTKLVCSAAAAPDELYRRGDGAFEFERTASRLIEMQSQDYLKAERSLASRGDG